tara:strand:- start:1081 stop:1386 length:306 start_codon:yes stop_codon:yes gene_type:complete
LSRNNPDHFGSGYFFMHTAGGIRLTQTAILPHAISSINGNTDAGGFQIGLFAGLSASHRSEQIPLLKYRGFRAVCLNLTVLRTLAWALHFLLTVAGVNHNH